MAPSLLTPSTPALSSSNRRYFRRHFLPFRPVTGGISAGPYSSGT